MLTMTDLFCGAGGSSTGATQVPGIEIRLAMNHWDRAIETHNTNHPNTDHLCADIQVTNPRYLPSTDVLWASPECTNHSIAKGRKVSSDQPDLFGDTLADAAAERSRATMWDVPRFAEAHNYKVILIENVVEAINWVPFQSWLASMDALGYDHQKIFLNSMHATWQGAGAPQSRDRMYVCFWKKGNPRPNLEALQRPKAWCQHCEQVVSARQWWKNPDRQHGKYRSQYLYRCPNHACRNSVVEPFTSSAETIIDWSHLGERIADRTKPLAAKTIQRINKGIEKYWSTASQDRKPLVMAYYGSGLNTLPASQPISTITTVERHTLLSPGTSSSIEDTHLRMLTPHEIKRAMAFPDHYKMTGTRREQVKQAGNAVTPPAARDLVAAAVQSLS